MRPETWFGAKTWSKDGSPLLDDETIGEPTASQDTDHAGRVFDRYLVEHQVGEGGYAVVYKVRHQILGTVHALKVLKPGPPRLMERMVQEGRLQAGLRHPNIVPVTDVIDASGTLGLLMDFVDGPPLDRWLATHRPSAQQAEAIFRGIVEGVGAAHKRGIIHRDLKPGNVMLQLEQDGIRPRVTDFGLARKLEQDVDRTQAGVGMGTPGFMAPEQIQDARGADERADIFALGCILYMLATGERPFPGTDLHSILAAQLKGRYRSPRELAPELPRKLLLIIDKCLKVDRVERPPDCDSLLTLLGEAPQQAPASFSTLSLDERWTTLRVRGELGNPEVASGEGSFKPLSSSATRSLRALASRAEELTNARAMLPPVVVDAAQKLLEELPSGPRLRVHAEDRGLLGVPWELICGEALRRGDELVRTVASNRPVVPREVTGPLRVLVADGLGQADEVDALRRALAGPRQRGELDWLPPVIGPEVRLGALINRLRESPRPHVLVLRCALRRAGDGRPELRLGPSEQDWVPLEMPALALDRRLCRELRVLVLELALPPDCLDLAAQAAASLASDGVAATFSMSLPLPPTVRTPMTASFLTRLASTQGGDVLEALRAARQVAGEPMSAGFYAPSLSLRGELTELFDYGDRTLVERTGTIEGASLLTSGTESRVRRDLEGLLSRPGRTTVLVGDAIDPDGERIGNAQLHRQLMSELEQDPRDSLARLMQTYELLQDRDELRALVQHTLEDVNLEASEEGVLAVDFIARLAAPGLFVTLLWLPLLEAALATHHPEARIVVLQPLRPGGLTRLKSFRREPGDRRWRRGDDLDTSDPDFRNDFIVLRLFGGCATPGRGVHGDPVLTENDLLEQLASLDELPDALLAQFRRYPVCSFGLLPNRWAHREVLRRLAGAQPMAPGSLAVLPARPSPTDLRYWQWDRGPAGGAGRVQTLSYEDFIGAAQD